MLWSLLLSLRLLRGARVLAKHDALSAVEAAGFAPPWVVLLRRLSRRVPGRPGQKLARALTELGPSFIKLGQFLATRADLLGEEMAADLAELQDRLPPFPAAEARQAIEQEFDQSVDALFASFEDEPVSAASIAQVHLATTRPSESHPESRKVAVKVLRPGIEQAFERDLELFYWLARLAERTAPKMRRFKPVEVIDLFAQTVRIEMDLRMEAAACSELLENFAEDDSYVVPEIDWHRTSRRVLTQSRVGGIRMDNREALLAAGHDLEAVLGKAAAIFFNQVFRDGFFHGDQHPGNMSVTEEGAIAAVDFGIMGRLDRKTRFFLADMLLATLARDYKRLAEVHVEAGYLPPGQPLDLFAQALRAVCEPIFGEPLHRISFALLLGQLLKLTESFDMPVQPQLVLLQKNMLMAEGVSRRLDPKLNIWLLSEPLITEWMQVNRGPQARLRDAGDGLVRSLERLPTTLHQIEGALEQISGGGVELHPKSVEALRGGTPRSGTTARWAFLLASLALAVALIAALD
jgi:ubiquinone biosynthesis protein